MAKIHCRIECKVTFDDGSTELRNLDYTNDSTGVAEVNREFAENYVRDELENVNKVEIIDVLYYNDKS